MGMKADDGDQYLLWRFTSRPAKYLCRGSKGENLAYNAALRHGWRFWIAATKKMLKTGVKIQQRMDEINYHCRC
jgi:hypothetical protein